MVERSSDRCQVWNKHFFQSVRWAVLMLTSARLTWPVVSSFATGSVLSFARVTMKTRVSDAEDPLLMLMAVPGASLVENLN